LDEFWEDPTDVSMVHVLISCALVGAGLLLWEAVKRVARALWGALLGAGRGL
jgi:hypothetical protein